MQGSVFLIPSVVFIVLCTCTHAQLLPGMPCTAPADCNKAGDTERLDCVLVGETKRCECPAGFVFEYSSRRDCFAKVGSACPTPSSNVVKNSECDVGTGQVKCTGDFKPISNSGRCVSPRGETNPGCVDDYDCDDTQSLQCIFAVPGTPPGVCGCPLTAHYDNNICRYKTGVKCEVPQNEYIPQIRCPLPSTCSVQNDDGNYYCSYLHHSESKCNQDPNVGIQCNADEYLACDDNSTCVCANEFGGEKNVVFNKDTKQCELLINAKCTESNNGKRVQMCTGNSTCQGETCKCGANYASSFDLKTCHGLRGEPCGSNEFASCSREAFLTCGSRNKCECESNDGEDIWYDEETHSCTLLAKSTCKNGENDKKCVKNASCERSNGGRICECNAAEGFKENSKGRCFLPYGTSCNTTPDLCDVDGFQKCGSNGKCECKDTENQVYQNGACRTKVDKDCSTTPCVNSAFCGSKNTCECVVGTTNNGKGKCVIQHGNECGLGVETPGECDSDSFLKCLDNTCQCSDPENTEFKEGKGCVSNLNAPCSKSIAPCNDDFACIANQCKCDSAKKLVPRNDSCVITLFGTCNPAENKCNPDEFLVCLGTTCQCDASHPLTAVGNVQKCMAKGAAKCNKDSDCDTVNNFVCGETNVCECKEGYEQNLAGVCDGAGVFSLSVALVAVTLLTAVKNLVGV